MALRKTKGEANSEMDKRWTPTIMSDGFTPVPTVFLKHYTDKELGITSAEAMLILHLMSYKWDEKRPYPKFSRIAARMNISETAVRTHARHLEQRQLLRRIKRPGTTNEFDLTPLFRKLEEVHAKAEFARSLQEDQEASE